MEFSRQEYWSGLPFPSPMHESEKWKWSHSVVSDSSRPHGLQPTKLLHPWDFPGKSTGVGCHRLPKPSYFQLSLYSILTSSFKVYYICWVFSVSYSVTSLLWRLCTKYGRIISLSGEGNGTPLQYSCLENPMDGGAWWAAVHGVTKSRTWLSAFTFTFHFHALEEEMATHSSVLA